jgi:hypothetical protein
MLLAAADAAAADLDLVLAIDASGSVSPQEFDLQLRGLADAFRDAEIAQAIRASPGGVAVTLMQWSGPGQQAVAVPWSLLDDAATSAAFGERIEAAGRLIEGETAIGPALQYGAELLAARPEEARRRVIDVSGDGASNWGADPDAVRDSLMAAGIIINGVVILNEQSSLDAYYRDHVIGGTGAFLETAADYADFARAIRIKLLREIRGTPVGDNERTWQRKHVPASGERLHLPCCFTLAKDR